MVGLSQLWLPMVISAVIVFVASSIVHMVLPWHKGDFSRLPAEDRFRDAVKPLGLAPGDYLVPCPQQRDAMKSPEFIEKMKSGPVIVMTVRPNGPPAMGGNLALWFIYCFVVSLFAAYIAGRARPAGTDYLQVFRFAGCTAFIGYSLALAQNSIWWSRKWSTTIKSMIDGLLYGLLTAGVFGWLWPR